MKYASVLCLFCLLLVAATCKRNNQLETSLLGKTWLHSYEEDEGDITVYRPNTYDFPPSRGRTGFALEPGGVIRRFEIAPTDGLEEHEGSWLLTEKNLLEVHMKDSQAPPQNYTIEIVSLEDGVLKVKQQPNLKEE
ncbi:hypothetical protein I2I11_08880 [Pontibacter sp. 172403-2]|uniref:hypothetical protein n=1 Tax=Pontibacter rufus TaxID=2791028 RepID=UPI0018AFDF57|nr:hypothetical protein [Pontibacter sp. 172403-2]MBF9253404.1 hypothetical protein [Pontibacter sp. 172403-2]